MSNVELIVGNLDREYKSLYFPGGEPHIELSINAQESLKDLDSKVLIHARVGSMNDFGTLLALTSAVKRFREDITLFMPYFPGARQDRHEEGFAFTVKMYADIINAQEYDSVNIVDPHSSVTPALVDRCYVVPHYEAVAQFISGLRIEGLICPDAGAEKRTLDLAKFLRIDNVVYARKIRDPKTGKLYGSSLGKLPTIGEYLVVDDICDGGGTFLGLAEEWAKDPYAKSPYAGLHLWVTHGIFSKGLDELFKHYANIGCTDSFPSETRAGATVINLKGRNSV